MGRKVCYGRPLLRILWVCHSGICLGTDYTRIMCPWWHHLCCWLMSVTMSLSEVERTIWFVMSSFSCYSGSSECGYFQGKNLSFLLLLISCTHCCWKVQKRHSLYFSITEYPLNRLTGFSQLKVPLTFVMSCTSRSLDHEIFIELSKYLISTSCSTGEVYSFWEWGYSGDAHFWPFMSFILNIVTYFCNYQFLSLYAI